jgi:hypothetical protein
VSRRREVSREQTILIVAIRRFTKRYSGATVYIMNNRATKFKMSVTIPNASFFIWSSLVKPEGDVLDDESTRRTSFIIKPHMHVNSSVARDLTQN